MRYVDILYYIVYYCILSLHQECFKLFSALFFVQNKCGFHKNCILLQNTDVIYPPFYQFFIFSCGFYQQGRAWQSGAGQVNNICKGREI